MFISYFFLSQKPRQYPNYVSSSPSPSGVKAFYTYLEKKTDVKRWSNSPSLLSSKEENKVLIMIEPLFIPENKEMKAYKNFMEAGNTILLLKNNPKGMFDLETEMIAPNGKVQKVYNPKETAFHAELSSQTRLQAKQESEVLLHDEDGAIALKRSFGKGQLIVSVTPDWVINGNLLNNDHIPLLFTLINEGNSQKFMFDEYIHRDQNAPTSLTVYPKWFLVMLLQGVLFAIFWLWYRGKRFGSIFIRREETVRFSDEGIQALAAWYIRGRRYHDSLTIQADYVRLLIQERWGVPITKDWKEISSHFERKLLNMNSTEIHSLINGLKNILEKEKVSKQEYLLWSKKLDRLRKEVERG